MLQNAYFLAKIGADTAENEQHFAEILPKIGNYPTRRPVREALRSDREIHAGPPGRIEARPAAQASADLGSACCGGEHWES